MKYGWIPGAAAAAPVIFALCAEPRWAFLLIMFFALVGTLAPGFDRLCQATSLSGKTPYAATLATYAPTWVRSCGRWADKKCERYAREIVAISLAIIWTIALIVVAKLVTPLFIQGGIDAIDNGTKFVQQAPERFQGAWDSVREWLVYFGVSQEIIDAPVAWLRSYLSSLIHPGTEFARWLGSYLWRGTVSVAVIIFLPYAIIIVLYFWKDDESMTEGVVRSFLPREGADHLINWWSYFTGASRKLFKAMAVSMFIFSIVFSVILWCLNFIGYPMSMPRAVFDGTILGVTGGIPVYGGIINYVTITLISLASYGFDWKIWTLLFSVVAIVHYLEVSVVTPWVVGAHLKFSTTGLMLSFFTGLACWGTTIEGVGMSLFLLPYFRACKMVCDDMRNSPKPRTFSWQKR